MGFGQRFARNMAKRTYQYAVRSTYPLLDSTPLSIEANSRPRGSKKSAAKGYADEKSREKVVTPPKDKLGQEYHAYFKKAIFGGKEYDIVEVKGKMITLSDGKNHRVSSCEFV